MAKTLKEKNQMDCNKRAREKYMKMHYKMQTVKLRIEEYQELDTFCKNKNISKNGFIRECIKMGMKADNPLI